MCVLKGLVGIAAGLSGAADVTLTDLKYCLKSCEAAIEFNKKGLAREGATVRAEPLDWFSPPVNVGGKWDVILAADVVWLVELVAPFVSTLEALCPPGSDTVIFFSYQRRGADADTELWKRVKAAQFHIHGPVPFEAFGSNSNDGTGINLSIYILSRSRAKPEHSTGS